MAATSSSPFCIASIAACCAVVGAHISAYWCSLVIIFISGAGAQAYPSRQPVMANDLENPLMYTVRSAISGNDTMLTCGSSP